MKKIIFLVLAMAFVLSSCGQDEVVQVVDTAEVAMEKIEEAKQEIVEQPKTVLSANYEEYNEGSLGEAENTVLFFHAGWCPSCVTAETNFIDS